MSIVEQALQLRFEDESRGKRAEYATWQLEVDAVFERAAVRTDRNHAVLVPPRRKRSVNLNVCKRLTGPVVRVFEIPPEREGPEADSA